MDRNKIIDEVLEVLWDLELKYLDKELTAIKAKHQPLEEEFMHKCDAIARARFVIEEMKEV